jgi:hypothetical protein
MPRRVKLVSPNGGTEIEINEADCDYYLSIGYTAKSKKPANSKTKEIK